MANIEVRQNDPSPYRLEGPDSAQASRRQSSLTCSFQDADAQWRTRIVLVLDCVSANRRVDYIACCAVIELSKQAGFLCKTDRFVFDRDRC